jgi:hypothetical protein
MKWHTGCESLGKTTFRFTKHWLHKSYGFYAIKGRGHTILFVKPEGTRPLGVDRIILKQILNTWDMTVCTGFFWLRIETGGELL